VTATCDWPGRPFCRGFEVARAHGHGYCAHHIQAARAQNPYPVVIERGAS
jgi:hypothetical protein